jgi:hypothetical protein
MTNTLTDFNRRTVRLHRDEVEKILPEYFLAEYPTFVTAMDTYYGYTDSDNNIHQKLLSIETTRDIEQTTLALLNFLINDLGDGASTKRFLYPRTAAKMLPELFKLKGSAYSAEMFFRMFYGEDIQIVYPKDQLIIVGETPIGYDHLYKLQDGALNQVLSILIKSPLALSTWKTLFKKYVHPAGFYLGAEVKIENIGSFAFTAPEIAVVDSDITLTIEGIAGPNLLAQGEMTGIYVGDSTYSVSLDRKIEDYAQLTAQQLADGYATIADLMDVNPPTFDVESDGTPMVDFTSNVEKFDGNKHE